jgi:hypothetical protein
MNSERMKLIAVSAILAICCIWLIAYLAFSSSGYGTARRIDTPGSLAAGDLTKKLVSNQKFADVGVIVLEEKPLKFKVVGATHSAADLESLKEMLKQSDPDHEFEYDVLVMPH